MVLPAPSSIKSGSGNQCVSHHTPRPMRAPRLRNHQVNVGVPIAPGTNHTSASTPTKLSYSSLRQTKLLHSGYWFVVNLPINSHFAAVVSPAANQPARYSTGPA